MIRPEVKDRRILRARSALFRHTLYVLGKGGFNPTKEIDHECDCSGFAAWLMEISRKPKLTRWWWIETTNIWRDATGKEKVFRQLRKPEVGCFIVYPDKHGRQGHIAMVSDVDTLGGIKIIDCSSSNSRQGDAIKERSGNWMRAMPNAIYCCLAQDLETQ